VAGALRQEGYRVEHQIGQAGFSIDLAVVDPDRPGRYLLGIECDGATYHSARMARDRDRARQAVLESLGWTIHRIWSTDWFRNPQEQLSRTVAAIEKAKRRAEAEETADEAGMHAPDGNASGDAGSDPSGEDAASLEDPASPADPMSSGDPSSSAEGANRPNGPDASSSGGTAPRSSGDVSSKGDAARPKQGHATTIERAEEAEDEGSIAEPYEAAELDIDIAKRLHEVSASQMAVWVRRVVRVESPVDAELVARRIMGAAGVTRLGRRIKEAIWGGVEHACRRGKVGKADGVLFWTDQDGVPVRDRSDADDDTRDIEMVPAQEIAAAARELTEGAFGVDAEDLVRQVSRTLGFDKMGSNIRRRIEAVVGAMVDRGTLARENGHLVVAESPDAESGSA
jgi:very-short-patch-repair endonuclease